jgi:hypothetical protein
MRYIVQEPFGPRAILGEFEASNDTAALAAWRERPALRSPGAALMREDQIGRPGQFVAMAGFPPSHMTLRSREAARRRRARMSA